MSVQTVRTCICGCRRCSRIWDTNFEPPARSNRGGKLSRCDGLTLRRMTVWGDGMSSVTVDSGARPLNPSIIGGTSVAVQIFPALVYPNAGLNSVAVSTPGPLSLPIPVNGQYEMQDFVVKASGKVFVL